MKNSEEKHATLLSRRRLLINGAIATAGLGVIGEAGAQQATGGTQPGKASDEGLKMPTFVEPPALIKGVALPS